MDPSVVQYILGPAGAAGLCLLFILTGLLVPKPYHERVLKENEKLQQANDILSEANATLREANRALTGSGALTNEVLTTLLNLAQNRQVTGADYRRADSVTTRAELPSPPETET